MPKFKLRYLSLFVFLGVVGMLAGCPASLDRKPENVLESLYVASTYGASLTRSVNDAYVGGSITKAQQLDALDSLQEAKNGVDAGVAAYLVGNYGGARDRLDVAEAALRSVAVLLAKYGDLDE